MIRIGTAYFRSLTTAAQYYRDTTGNDGYRTASKKLAEGEIYIGRPPCDPGERVVLIDNGTRYAIEVQSWDKLTERKRKE